MWGRIFCLGAEFLRRSCYNVGTSWQHCPSDSSLEVTFICKEEPVNFLPMLTSLQIPPAIVENDLSTDQRILMEYITGISSDSIMNERLDKIRLGPLRSASRRTTATYKDPKPVHKHVCAQQRPQVSGAVYPVSTGPLV
jgi:hypothetical protein